MAPEQAQGGEIDERVDVYGAAAVLFGTKEGRASTTGVNGGRCFMVSPSKTNWLKGFGDLRKHVEVGDARGIVARGREG